MLTQQSTNADPYNQLQRSLDKVIGKIGVSRTKELLDSFIETTSVTQNSGEKIKMITQYLSNLAIKVFDLDERLFFTSMVTEYRDARYCCFQLLRKFTNDSYPKIAIHFSCNPRKVMYGCAICEDRLNFPKVHGAFVNRFQIMESKLIEFIGKIN